MNDSESKKAMQTGGPVPRGITKENLLLILPPALTQDPSKVALASVNAEVLAARPAEIDRVRVISNIDWLDEAVLDILAYDFKVDWWDADYTLEEKRRILKDSWRVHKMLGTKAAVETAIRAIYPKTEVQEWFEYKGGKPYHFKINIDLSDIQCDETRPWRVLERVNFYKSLRSHLDDIVFTLETTPATLHVGSEMGAVVNMEVPVEEDVFDFQHTLSIGGTAGANVSIGIPKEPDVFDFQSTLAVGGTVGADANIAIPKEPDGFDFQASLHTGGNISGQTHLEVPEDTAQPSFRSALRAGGSLPAHTVLPVPEDTALPPAVTILRTGSVCTIISNRREE